MLVGSHVVGCCCLADRAKVREGHSAKNTVAARTIANDLPRTGCEENLISPLENVLLAYAASCAIPVILLFRFLHFF